MTKTAPLRFPISIPFAEHLGFELHSFAEGEAELRVEVDPAYTNSWQVAHGGVVMTLLDVAMAHAALSHDTPRGMATVEMKTSFLRPATGRLRAVGRRVHRTASLAFCEAQLFDGHGRLCATASGTFKTPRTLRSHYQPNPPSEDPR